MSASGSLALLLLLHLSVDLLSLELLHVVLGVLFGDGDDEGRACHLRLNKAADCLLLLHRWDRLQDPAAQCINSQGTPEIRQPPCGLLHSSNLTSTDLHILVHSTLAPT